MTSAKLEDALSLLPEKQRKAFENRHRSDLVVVYDSHSVNWPRKDTGNPAPLARLWELIYEHEFAKKLERTPALLTKVYAGWVEFIKMRAAKHAQAYALANGYNPRKPMTNGHGPPPP
jgi:ubiquitin carboxyl-terminal hydrolase 8